MQTLSMDTSYPTTMNNGGAWEHNMLLIIRTAYIYDLHNYTND